MEKPLDHEDYRIPGTNMSNFSKWSRENIPKAPPSLSTGDKVIFTLETEITKVGEDCDGTTLYTADMIGGGWSEDCFKKM